MMLDIKIYKGHLMATMESQSDRGKNWMLSNLYSSSLTMGKCLHVFPSEHVEDFVNQFERIGLICEVG